MEISELQYARTLEKAALDAAKARVKQYNQYNKELSRDEADKMSRAYFDDFLKKLEMAYPYDKVTLDDLSAIKNYSSDKMQEYLYQFNAPNRQALSPTEHVKAIKAADILPLLQGVAKEGRDWTSMDNMELKKFGYDHGYDVKNKEGYAKLLKDIGEQQINYDRAKIAQEAKDQMGWTYVPRQVIAPSAMQEFENAIMTGGDYDAGTAAKMGAVDALTNAAMLEAPSIRLVKNNITNGILGAIAQAGGEATRQGLEVGLSDNGQSFDIAPVLFAGSAGATRPAIIGTAQGSVARIPGENAAQFSRGIAKALKTGDPSAREAEQLASSVLNYNQNVANYNKTYDEVLDLLKSLTKIEVDRKVVDMIRKGNKLPSTDKFLQLEDLLEYTFGPNNGRPYKELLSTHSVEPLAKVEKAIAASKVPEKAKVLGVAPEADGTYSASKILDAYNKPLWAHQNVKNGIASFGAPNYIGKTFREPVRVLDNESNAVFRQMFPSKYMDESQANAWTKAGLNTGNVLGAIGSRLEPTFKLGSSGVGVNKTYKDENWYQALPIRSKKIIDEAFKKKDEEETEEE